MIGTRLGLYEILEEIGKGGWATVFRAYQPSVDRQVAVKVLHKSIVSDQQAMERFRREARIIARLEHPHILPVYDFDGFHDPPYIVMRYMDSGTLAEAMKKHSLTLEATCDLFQQVASALDYAHKQGVVHRDIKPSNIMLDRQGNAMVCDFGIARLIRGASDSSSSTAAGAIIGTPSYMAPEQMGGEKVDHRADLYSMGVMMFEALTGQTPYPGANPVQVLMKVMNDPVPSAYSLNPDLPAEVDILFTHLIAKDPSERFSTASEMAGALTTTLGKVAPITPTRPQDTLVDFVNAPRQLMVGDPAFKDTRRTPSEQNRLVTTIHVDAKDYASLVEEVEGAEASRNAVQALWDQADSIIHQLGGQVLSRSEEALMALWGVEITREDDAERAVHAALEIQSALRRLGPKALEGSNVVNGDEPFLLATGIHTGAALLTPAEKNGVYNASGNAITLASRLAENPEGGILITPETYQVVRGVFSIELDSTIKLRGRKEPLQVYRVNAVKPRPFRLEARGVEGVITQMVGREVELKKMQEAYLAVIEDQETQLVTVVGEAGMGKSRLLLEFSNWAYLRREKVRLFQGRGVPDMPPYALLRDILSFRFEILDSDSPAIAREKIEGGFGELIPQAGADIPTIAHRLGQLAGFDFSDSIHIMSLLNAPQGLAEQGKAAFLQFFCLLSENMPVLILLEDLHYADEASLRLFDELVHAHRNLPLILVAAARTQLYDRFPFWGAGRNDLGFDLQPLSRRENRNLVREILQKVNEVPRSLLDLIIERAEGNPYYTEELVKVLIEDRVVQKGENPDSPWIVEESRLEKLAVPQTLVGLLQARLDSLLHPERLALQRAAVFGRVFWDQALQALQSADGIEVDLPLVLPSLVLHEFIYPHEPSAFEDSREYTFGQSMLRDVIYESMVKRQQRTYHSVAAGWLRKSAPEHSSEYHALIAEHYERAGRHLDAVEFLQKVAQRASSVGAYTEATNVLERSLRLLASTTTNPTAETLRARVLLNLGEIFSYKGAYSEAEHISQQALELAHRLGDAQQQASALGLLARIAQWRGDFTGGRAYLEQALPLARTSDDRPTLIFILRQLGNILASTGNASEAIAYHAESLDLAQAEDDKNSIALALNSLGSVYMDLRDWKKAVATFKQGQSLARQLGNNFLLSIILGNIGQAYIGLGDHAAALEATQEALELGREANVGVRFVLSILGHAALHLGQLDTGRKHLLESLRLTQSPASDALTPYILIYYTHLLAQTGQALRGVELLGLVKKHPAADHFAREEADLALKEICQVATPAIVETEIQPALERGASLDVSTVFQDLINKA